MAELTTEVEDAPVAFLDVYWRDFEQGEEIFTGTLRRVGCRVVNSDMR